MIGMVAHLLSSRSGDKWLLFPWWNDWCSKAPKYDGESARNKWSSFSNEESRKIIGTLGRSSRRLGSSDMSPKCTAD